MSLEGAQPSASAQAVKAPATPLPAPSVPSGQEVSSDVTAPPRSGSIFIGAGGTIVAGTSNHMSVSSTAPASTSHADTLLQAIQANKSVVEASGVLEISQAIQANSVLSASDLAQEALVDPSFQRRWRCDFPDHPRDAEDVDHETVGSWENVCAHCRKRQAEVQREKAIWGLESGEMSEEEIIHLLSVESQWRQTGMQSSDPFKHLQGRWRSLGRPTSYQQVVVSSVAQLEQLNAKLGYDEEGRVFVEDCKIGGFQIYAGIQILCPVPTRDDLPVSIPIGYGGDWVIHHDEVGGLCAMRGFGRLGRRWKLAIDSNGSLLLAQLKRTHRGLLRSGSCAIDWDDGDVWYRSSVEQESVPMDFWEHVLVKVATLGRTRVAEFLLGGKHVSPEVEDEDGRTPLHLAAKGGHESLAYLLLCLGVDHNRGEPLALDTPLHLAAGVGSKQIMEWLLQAQAEIDARNRSGATPLMRAAVEGQAGAVQLLFDRGASMLAADLSGLQARDFARGAARDVPALGVPPPPQNERIESQALSGTMSSPSEKIQEPPKVLGPCKFRCGRKRRSETDDTCCAQCVVTRGNGTHNSKCKQS